MTIKVGREGEGGKRIEKERWERGRGDKGGVDVHGCDDYNEGWWG